VNNKVIRKSLFFIILSVIIVFILYLLPFKSFYFAHITSTVFPSFGTKFTYPEIETLPSKDIKILVEKKKYKLTVYINNKPAKTYPIALGQDPFKDKRKRGDRRTPEGIYYVAQKTILKKPSFLGTRWIRLSYPDIKDAKEGLKRKYISKNEYDKIKEAIEKKQIPLQNTKLGGGIGVHGGGFNVFGRIIRNWTQGCIALYNSDIEELYKYVDVGTIVEIR
jgi:murein L,D-transpeptidase YafK